jgi:hypothetical protein
LVVDYSALKKRGLWQAHKLSDEVMGFVEKAKDEGHGTEAVKRLIEDRFLIRVHRRSVERPLGRRKKMTINKVQAILPLLFPKTLSSDMNACALE